MKEAVRDVLHLVSVSFKIFVYRFLKLKMSNFRVVDNADLDGCTITGKS